MSDSQIVAALAALGHTFRLNVWRMLLPYGQQGLPAGILASRLAVVPSSLSFHLRLMTQAGVLIQRRSSRYIIYAVNLDILEHLLGVFAACKGTSSYQLDEISNFFGEG